MKLSELIKDLAIIETTGDMNNEVADIAYHTRDISQGSCFIAIAGNLADGHDYIDKALENGAQSVVSTRLLGLHDGISNVVVDNTRRALARMSACFFGEPSKRFKLIGITGTNGKTTITYLIESIWDVCGFNTGIVGTVNYRYGNFLTNPQHTTPESYELQKLFKKMSDAGIDHVAMEVSSHSLDQDRVYGCNFDGAIFTNLTQDHLDYHLDMQRYKKSKQKLFNEHLLESSKDDVWAVFNIDDSFGIEMSKDLSCKIYTYSLKKDADVFVKKADYSLKGIKLTVNIGGENLYIKTHLIGRHNASNILAAIAASYAMGLPFEKIKKGIESLERVPGRLEPVPNSKGLNILVDYAHTPDALKNVTTALKELKPKRLITVFGCGGDRDKSKRPLMGFETALRSDVLIVTSDNPRNENPQKIIDEILLGVKKVGLSEYKGNGYGYFVEINRMEAIKKAIEIAEPEDLVLIAGKGHEDYQIVGQKKYAFEDQKVALDILAKI